MDCIMIWGLLEGLVKGTFCDELTEQVLRTHIRGCKSCNFVMSRNYARLKLTSPEYLEKSERLRKGEEEKGHLTAFEIVEMIYRNSIPEDVNNDPIYKHLSECKEGCPEMFMQIVKLAQRLEIYFSRNPIGCVEQEARWWRITRL